MAEKRRVPKAKHGAGKPAAPARARQAESDSSNDQIEQLRKELDELSRKARGGDRAKSAVARLNQELRRRTMRMEQQLAVARQFKSNFMPPALPAFPQVRFAVKYQPSPRVGGDLYDICDLGNSCVGILLADASGNGLTSTLTTAVTKIAFDTFRQNEYSPKAILDRMNRQILRNTLDDQFLTAFLGILDLETLRLKFVNAAHPRPILYGPRRFELLDTEGLCCGMFEEPRYEEKEVQLHAGDRVLFFTRGLLEMCRPGGRRYTSVRLHALVRAHRELEIGPMVDRIRDDFERNLAGAEPSEDLTLLGLELLPRETREERIVIPSEPMHIARVEALILSALEALNYGERSLFGVRLALEEAIINAMKHGNDMEKSKNVTITYSADRAEFVVNIEDEGPGFNPAAVPDPTADENLENPHGRGLTLMRAYMDEVSFSPKGNCVTMRKKAPWA